MRTPRWRPRPLAAVIAIASLCVFSQACAASEEARKFLDALRNIRYFDTALEHLEVARTSPRVDKDFKSTIDYESGLTLIYQSRMGGTFSIREKQLSKARECFDRFLAEHPDHPLATDTESQLANVLVERGSIKVGQAERRSKDPEHEAALRAEARQLYAEAQEGYEGLDKRFLEEHKQFRGVNHLNDPKKREARDQVRRNLLQVGLALGGIRCEIAHTYEPGTDGYKQNLEAAAEKYREYHEKYGDYVASLYARLGEGRCYKELGRTDEALDVFEDLFAMHDQSAACRLVKNKAAVLALETALLPSVKQHKEALGMYREWATTASPDEAQSTEGLAIKFLSGEAALEYAQSLDKNEEKKTRKEILTLAKQLLRDVSRADAGSRAEVEYKKKANVKLRDKLLGGTDELAEPTNFAEASDRARDQLDRMQTPGLEPEEAAAARAEAVKYCRMAMRMKTPEVTTAQVNVIRHYLAYLYWSSNNLYEAAVMGEFLARRYSSSIEARQGARIALAAYAGLLFEAVEAKKAETAKSAPEQSETDRWDSIAAFARNRLIGIAKYMTELWKGESEADEAWIMLVRVAIHDRKPKTAQECLANIPTESPRRGEAELKTGQSLWSAYLKASRLPDNERPPQAQLDAMVAQAQQILEAGITRTRKIVEAGGEPTYTLLASVLSLAQTYIGAGEAHKAIAWLDDPKIGIMTLVDAKHPATNQGNIRIQTLMAALRAYVAVEELDKAEKVMNALEELIGGGAKLTRIYIGLGRQLEEQLKDLRAAGKHQEADKVSQGFELFLTRISRRETGNTFNSLYWVAGTLQSLGAALDPGGSSVPAQAQAYYGKAVDTYRKIIDLCKSQEGFAPQARADDGIKIRLAQCLRRLGKHKEAMDRLVEILKVHNQMVTAQVEAAYTYQAWGDRKPGAYELAIKGGRRIETGDNVPVFLVWGWGKTARMVARSPKHQDVFFEARYNLALCRFKLAKSKAKAAQEVTLRQAQKDVLVVNRLYPKMGGAKWYGKFDELLKNIQRLRGIPVTGLQALEKKPASSQ